MRFATTLPLNASHNLLRSSAMIFLRQVARFLLALLLCLDAHRVGRAGSVSLHPTADTTISQKTSVPTTELVIGTNGKSQSSRALLKFDIAGNIPSNAIITSAALTVTVTKVPPGGGISSLFDLRAVLFAWSPSDATWANRLAATPWSTLGGAVGVDFSNKISQTNFFGSATGLYTFISNSNLVADVQNWLQNASANFGWVVISEMQGVLHSERTLDASSPTLLVQFTVPATP
ncbi:MAG TPA: DNRLRE domain-containing protein, partial [Verrucomicrobiae bacterium]